MITDNKSTYQEAKNRVLSVYESFVALTENELIKKVINSSRNVLESLDNEIGRVKEDKFNLLVAGEAKCGKSTFINAYLGVDILPMDVMQCTSSIIEIKYGEEFLLEAEYADGTKRQIKGEETIRQFLKENAAIDENYRSIPVPVINTEILMKSKGNPSKRDIKNLIEGVKDANIHNLSESDYEKKIREYIEMKKVKWNTIVIKLTVSYPFESEELKEIQIIDSPGVNAAGKIGDSTEKYINNADAIMFLKPLAGAAVESIEFKNFLEKSSKNKSKNTLFLILTRAADSKEEEIQRLVNQAGQVYKNISSDKILPVDSKVQMYKQQFKNMSSEEVQEWILKGLQEGSLDKFIAAPWMMSAMNVKVFLEELEKIAKFEYLNVAIESFGRKAHFNRLNDILNKFHRLIKKIDASLKLECASYEQKIKDPEQFVLDILSRESKFKELENKIFDGIVEVEYEFVGNTGKVSIELKKLSTFYKNEFDKLSGTNFNEVKKLSNQAIEDYSNMFIQLQKELIEQCNQKLFNLTNIVDIPYSVLEVSITPEEFKKIEQQAKKKATKNESIDTGLTFKKMEEKSTFSQDDYTKEIRNSILERFKDISRDSTNTIEQFTQEVLATYKSKLQEQAQDVLDSLHTIRKKSLENDEMILIVDCYKGLIGEIEKINSENESIQKEVQMNASI